LLIALSFLISSKANEAQELIERRLLTVADTIRMTVWANRSYLSNGAPDSPVAIFSPDHARFLIIVRKGNMERDAIESSLLLFESKSVFQETRPRVLITMSSSSHRDAIQRPKWIDNNNVVFLGQGPDGPSQVYQLDVGSGKLRKLTDHPTPVVGFDVSADGAEIVYEAVPAAPASELLPQSSTTVLISTQKLAEFLRCGPDPDHDAADRELFIRQAGEPAVRISTQDYLTEYLPLAVSRTGRYALLPAYVSNVPAIWRDYKDKLLHLYTTEQRRPGAISAVPQLLLLDLKLKQLTPLINAPLSWQKWGFAFAPDENSVAVSGSYLPLDVSDPQERVVRESRPSVIELSLPDRRITRISESDSRVVSWDERSGKLFLETETPTKPAGETYEKIASNWKHTDGSQAAMSGTSMFDVLLEENMNAAPKIFVSERASHKKRLLLDLNPELASINLGQVQAVRWKATDGHEVEGGLYLPPDYQPGLRYPVVIQSHGFRNDRFQANGPYNSAFAAQPLAARGIVVLQIGNAHDGQDETYLSTPEEAPRQMAVFEGAIDYLDQRGIADRRRVGLLGFSRTAFYVAYTLTHSKYRFAAATMADGFEAGYMNYLLWPNAEYASVNGGPPVGARLESWLRSSPGFNLDKINLPVHLENYGAIGVLGGWQWFSGLSLLGKPVEFIWLPHGSHLLVKPSERLASQQNTVDWFSFWLQGTVDSSPERKQQYERWQKLKEMLKPSGESGRNAD
jgi:dipeptidyl aminopeptidase/acylaminoacyl peptidase